MGSYGDCFGIHTHACTGRREIVLSLGRRRAQLLAHDCLELCFADSNAFVPRMFELSVRNTTAQQQLSRLGKYYVRLSTLDPPLQASTPSNQLYCISPSPTPPQFLYQAPPGAQQLRRPDFLNVPQFGHATTPGVAADAVDACHCASHR